MERPGKATVRWLHRQVYQRRGTDGIFYAKSYTGRRIKKKERKKKNLLTLYRLFKVMNFRGI